VSPDVRPADVALVKPARSTRRRTRPWTERLRVCAFLVTVHALPLIALASGVRPWDWLLCAAMYAVFGFAIGVCLHRYFAHRSFRTGRIAQAALAAIGTLVFTDPIGFSGKHRLHHRHSDGPGDVHSPREGLWYCWLGSLIDEGYTREEVLALVPDWQRYPELVWLHRAFFVPGSALALAFYALGGFSTLAIGFFLPLALVLHATSAVNYFGHGSGARRFATRDRSTNHRWVALVSFGEGWHNNHHRFPYSARAGFAPGEWDVCFLWIRALERLGCARAVRQPPDHVLAEARRSAARAPLTR
jgi:fatty-acid desaturase